MKFSIIGPFYPLRGGIAHFSAGIATALKTSGHQVQKISFKKLYPSFLYPGKSTQDPSSESIDPQIKFILDPLQPWSWKSCINQVGKFKPDLVLIQWWTTFWSIPFGLIIRSLESADIKSIFLVHNVLPHEVHFWDRALVKYALRKASAFVTLSTNEKIKLLELLPGSKISVCHHPIYTQFINENITKEEARESLGIPRDRPVILFFGIVRKYKGLDTLLNALSILKGYNPPPLLLIAGEFWEPKHRYKKIIQEMEIEDRVLIFDRYIPNDEVALYFSAADMLVAAYSAGTQSGVIKSAISFGLPIIISENLAEGMDQVYADRTFVVPPGNQDTLAEAIRSCLILIGTFSQININPDIGWLNLVKELELLAS